MKVRALRGVCIGVEQHLAKDEEKDLDANLVTYLTSIGAVEIVKDEPTAPVAEVAASPEVAATPEVAKNKRSR